VWQKHAAFAIVVAGVACDSDGHAIRSTPRRHPVAPADADEVLGEVSFGLPPGVQVSARWAASSTAAS
jgi:hypothetical protein